VNEFQKYYRKEKGPNG